MRPQIVKIYTCVLCLFASTTLFAAPQQVATEPPPPTLERTPGPELPIDSSIFILVAVAIIFGVYVAYRRHLATNAAQ
ncbi:hypothetical protein G5B37_09870 [Rasiella rasia]|uniref:Uncharacterized protein n=1 Tax=Rasiella rasia TaxID=2744027 RepID=A0A6G6GMT1_9FLAO|nr:hypothetical protein [Rasiella rasia]QIE59862.1 hypothetical protein G5B37_09870 [Rasiella rasia]